MTAGSLYIGGEWRAPSTAGVIEVTSPHSEEIIGRAPAAGPDDVERAVAAARAAVDEGPWPRLEQEGARRVRGGTDLPDGVDRGGYVRPTLFDGVDNGMRIAREEIFGPVLSVIPYRDEDEAVRIANDSDYGLSGSVWTADVDRGLGVARRVRTGTFGVNQPYSMDPAAPFGGVKASGFGRELGPEGLDEFLDVKAISIAS